jgi:hypothetical protein
MILLFSWALVVRVAFSKARNVGMVSEDDQICL